VQWIF